MTSTNKVWMINIHGMYPPDIPQDLLSVVNRLPHGINYGHYIIEQSQRMVRFGGSYTSRYDDRPHCTVDFSIEVPLYQGYMRIGSMRINLYREKKVCENCFHGLEAYLWSAIEKSLAGG